MTAKTNLRKRERVNYILCFKVEFILLLHILYVYFSEQKTYFHLLTLCQGGKSATVVGPAER